MSADSIKKLLPANSNAVFAVVSPDQLSIAFTGRLDHAEGTPRYGLFAFDVARKTAKCLIAQPLKTAPAWSPDSKKIAIGNSPGYGNVYPLVIVDVATGRIDSTGAQGAGAAWSPDGRYVAVSTQFGAAGSWLGGVPADGRIGIWDTVNRKLAYASPSGINVRDADHANWFISGSHSPVWSPDGRWIAWQQRSRWQSVQQKNGWDNAVWIARPDGTQLRRIFIPAEKVKWSEDSSSLVDLQSNTSRKIADVSVAAPGDWPAVPVELAERLTKEKEATKRAATFPAEEVLTANRVWQNPKLEGVSSLEFTHQIRPYGLDERFIWDKENGTSVEVVHAPAGNGLFEVGWRRVDSDVHGRFQMSNSGAYPQFTSLEEMVKGDSSRRSKPLAGKEIFRRETLRYLSGTRLNFTAIDWGRNPQDYVVRDYLPGAEQVRTVEIRPQRDALRDCVINAGAMFGILSNAYVHDLRFLRSVLTLDKQHRITRDVTYYQDSVMVDVALLDWTTTATGLQAPQRIVMSFPQQKFHVEQQFQIVDGRLWILKTGRSWFDGHAPQVQTITNLRINGSQGQVKQQLDHARQRLEELNAVAENPSTIRLQGLTPLELGATYSFQVPPAIDASDDRPASLKFMPDATASFFQLNAELRFPARPTTKAGGKGNLVLVLYDESRQPQLAATITEAVASATEPVADDLLNQVVKQHRLWLRNGNDPVPVASYKFHHSGTDVLAELPSKNEHVARGITLRNALQSYCAAPQECRVPVAISASWNGKAVKVFGLTRNKLEQLVGSGLNVDGGYSGSFFRNQPSGVFVVVDAQTGFPLVERSESMEFQYLDYVEASPGQFAPLRILCRNDQMQVDLRFQVLNGKLWLFDRIASAKPATEVFIDEITVEGKPPVTRTRSESAGQAGIVPPEFSWQQLTTRKAARAGDTLSEEFAGSEQPWRHPSWELLGQLTTLTEADNSRLVCFKLPRWPGFGKATTWSLTRTTSSRVEVLSCPETMPPSDATSVQVMPLVLNQPQLLPPRPQKLSSAESKAPVSRDAAEQIRVRQITASRDTFGMVSVVPELVSTSNRTQQSTRVSAVLLNADGVAVAGGHAHQQIITLGTPVVSNELRIPLLESGTEPKHFVLIGCRSVVNATPFSVTWITRLDEDLDPLGDIQSMLSSRFPEIREIGLAKLYFGREVSIYVYLLSKGQSGDSERNSPKNALAPHLTTLRMMLHGGSEDSADAIALACRLAGISGSASFAEPLRGLSHHSSEIVRDSALVGLGLLGHRDGVDRLKELAVMPVTEPSDEHSKRKQRLFQEAEAALAKLRRLP